MRKGEQQKWIVTTEKENPKMTWIAPIWMCWTHACASSRVLSAIPLVLASTQQLDTSFSFPWILANFLPMDTFLSKHSMKDQTEAARHEVLNAKSHHLSQTGS